MLHPEFPVIEDKYQMTEDWSLVLDQKHNRRFEDDSLVIWRPGFTMWIVIWNLDDDSQKERYEMIKADISPESFNIKETSKNDIFRCSYLLREDSEDDRQPAFYGFAVGSESHVQIAIYLDNESDFETAESIFNSLK